MGYPLNHSLSPVLQQVFLQETGLQGSYETFPIAPNALERWINDWAPQHLDGFNVTIPYKIQIMPYLNQLSETACLIGAVNMVTVSPQGLLGDNSDVIGFLSPLAASQQVILQDAHAVILGGGGASRAVAYALLQLGLSRLTFLVRDPQSAKGTLDQAGKMNIALCQGQAKLNMLKQAAFSDWTDVKIVVNTTPVGMTPHIENSPLPHAVLATLPQDCLVYDLVYNPLETRLLRDARAMGLPVQGGLHMLVGQGAYAFTTWTGMPLPQQTAESGLARLVQGQSLKSL